MANKNKLSKLFVVDLEATCYEDPDKTRSEGEIIEIGIIPIDLKNALIEYERGFRSFIKPSKTKVSDFCTDLTGITQRDLDEYGKPFPEVMQTISKLFSHNFPYSGWGEYDGKKIDSTCKEYGIKSPFSSRYLNLKTISCMILGMNKELGLSAVMKELGIPQEGRQHRAYDDALNTAKVFLKAMKGI